MSTLHPILLSDAERAEVHAFVRRGTVSARLVRRAQVLLKLSEGWRDAEVIRAFDVSHETVRRVRMRFTVGGVTGVLTDRRQTRRRQALTDAQATHLIAVACTTAPDGHGHWTLRLLAGKAVELGFVEAISPETIRALLKKTRSSPGSTSSGVSRR